MEARRYVSRTLRRDRHDDRLGHPPAETARPPRAAGRPKGNHRVRARLVPRTRLLRERVSTNNPETNGSPQRFDAPVPSAVEGRPRPAPGRAAIYEPPCAERRHIDDWKRGAIPAREATVVWILSLTTGSQLPQCFPTDERVSDRRRPGPSRLRPLGRGEPRARVPARLPRERPHRGAHYPWEGHRHPAPARAQHPRRSPARGGSPQGNGREWVGRHHCSPDGEQRRKIAKKPVPLGEGTGRVGTYPKTSLMPERRRRVSLVESKAEPPRDAESVKVSSHRQIGLDERRESSRAELGSADDV